MNIVTIQSQSIVETDGGSDTSDTPTRARPIGVFNGRLRGQAVWFPGWFQYRLRGQAAMNTVHVQYVCDR